MKYKFLLSLLLVLIKSVSAFAQKPEVFAAKTLAGFDAMVLWTKGATTCSKPRSVVCAGTCCADTQICQEADLGAKANPQYQFVCVNKPCTSACGNAVCDLKPTGNTCAENEKSCPKDCSKPAGK